MTYNMENKVFGIITSDIVNSKALKPQVLDKFVQSSAELELYKFIDQVEVYRGDGLQTLCRNPCEGLKAALVQYCTYKLQAIKVRQALGIGTVDKLSKSLAKSSGMAFQLSGKVLEPMKKENLLIALNFESAALNKEWEVHTRVLTDLFENWSIPQIEAVLLSSLGSTQVEIAGKLGISQVAVHQRLKSAKFYLLQIIMNRFTQMF
jgi:hypothetical protein